MTENSLSPRPTELTSCGKAAKSSSLTQVAQTAVCSYSGSESRCTLKSCKACFRFFVLCEHKYIYCAHPSTGLLALREGLQTKLIPLSEW